MVLALEGDSTITSGLPSTKRLRSPPPPRAEPRARGAVAVAVPATSSFPLVSRLSVRLVERVAFAISGSGPIKLRSKSAFGNQKGGQGGFYRACGGLVHPPIDRG